MKKDTELSCLRKILIIINFLFYHIFHIFTVLLLYIMFSFVFAIIIFIGLFLDEDSDL